MTSPEKTIEQLWYTWSRTGLDMITAGFRIRAASEGLRDIRSERVQRLNAYFYYSLPRDQDRSIALEVAPVSFVFTTHGSERILLHKVYTGQDDYGRYGAYFIHLLLNLPSEFSAHDAIALWHSNFWQCVDVPAERTGTHLSQVSWNDLQRTYATSMTLNQQQKKTFQPFLQYVIRAYLGKNLHAEDHHVPRPQLWIAASDDSLAQLISGLIQALPSQLVQTLTFSTYECHPEQATTEIVGRCWYAANTTKQHLPEELHPKNNGEQLKALLPPDSLQWLVLNCYTDTRSPLAEHPLVTNDPRIESLAHLATQYVLFHNKEYERLLNRLKRRASLTIREFLDEAEWYLRASNPTREDVERALTPRTPADYESSAESLSLLSYQEKVLELVLQEHGWWKAWRTRVIALQQKSKAMETQLPQLHMALLEMVQHDASSHKGVLPQAVEAVEIASRQGKDSAQQATTFDVLMDVMSCLAPPADAPEQWRAFLQQLRDIKHVQLFFENYPALTLQLLQHAAACTAEAEESIRLNDTERIQPWLTIVSWHDYGTALQTLPITWCAQITRRLIFDNTAEPLSPQILRILEKTYREEIAHFIKQMAQEAQQSHWFITMAFFDLLMKNGYPDQIQLCLVLLNSPLGEFEGNDERILHSLKADELAPYLKTAGPQLLPLGIYEKKAQIVLKMLGELAIKDAQQKFSVLHSWLKAAPIKKWVEAVPDGERNLAALLQAAQLSPQECDRFLQEYGKIYIPRYFASSTLLELFSRAVPLHTPQRIASLDLWLACPLEHPTLQQLLTGASLSSEEQLTFLQRYGERYLTRYPHSPLLLRYVQDLLVYLSTAGLSLFQGQGPSPTEQLLAFLASCSRTGRPVALQFPPQPFADWQLLANFVRDPSVLFTHTEETTGSIARVLYQSGMQHPTRTQVLTALARSAPLAPKQLPQILATLQRYLAGQDMVFLIFEMATVVNQSVLTRNTAKTLLFPCILAAAHVQSLFPQQQNQEAFWYSLLSTLLARIDTNTLHWLGKQNWPEETEHWRHEVRQWGAQVAPRIPWLDVPLLRQERLTALRQVRRALKDSHDEAELYEVALDCMTTLTCYDRHWTEQELALLRKQWNSVQPGDLAWALPPPQGNAPPALPAPISPEDQVPRWQREEAVRLLKDMLQRRNCSKIVRVAAQYETILKYCPEEIHSDWWPQIQLAWQFFHAWRQQEQAKTQQNWQELLAVADEMEKRREQKQPAPLFTAHEAKRIAEIRYQLAQQARTRGQALSGREAVARFSSALARSDQQPGITSTSSAAPRKKRWYNPGTWFG